MVEVEESPGAGEGSNDQPQTKDKLPPWLRLHNCSRAFRPPTHPTE